MDWLVGWLVGWLVSWLIDGLVGRSVGWLVGRAWSSCGSSSELKESRDVKNSFHYLKVSALEATQGQIDGFFSRITCKCHLKEVASVGD